MQPGCIYHLTHRCHNRQFLLKFVRDRDAYQRLLREEAKMQKVSVLNYCITSNHVHLLVVANSCEQVSRFMQKLQGVSAKRYNTRKARSGAFWSDRYHATMVETGEYFWRCMKYIDLNMVRAGAVTHPIDWQWTGYRELVAEKKRCRIIDLDAVLAHTGHVNVNEFVAHYRHDIRQALNSCAAQAREPAWTESIAVGSRGFVEGMETKIYWRIEMTKQVSESLEDQWVLREPAALYG